MIDLKKKFGKKLKELRKKANLSQEVFAEKIGISPRNLSKIETGVTFPNVINIQKISQILNCSEVDLFDFGYYEDSEYLRNEIMSMVKGFNNEQIKKLYRLIKIIN